MLFDVLNKFNLAARPSRNVAPAVPIITIAIQHQMVVIAAVRNSFSVYKLCD
jgi:hypothetical protein